MNTENTPIVIGNVSLDRDDSGITTMRATVDNQDMWFSVNGLANVDVRAEPFLAPALLPAMAQGRDIHIENAPLSPKLLVSLAEIQGMIKLWNPEAHKIHIQTETAEPNQAADIVTSGFSGGIDSMSTFIRRADDITHLLFMNGFDLWANESWSDAENRFLTIAEQLDRKAITVNTNVHEFIQARGISIVYAFGPMLAGVIDWLAPKRAYIASSYTSRELKPLGSHPLLDPLWSTEATEIIHDAINVRRSEKTALIAKTEGMLDLVQVCWDSRVGNCGKCTKCVRTMLTLKLLGITDGPFPKIDPMEHLHKMIPHTTQSAGFTWDLWQLAVERKQDDVARELDRIIKRYKRKRALKNFFKEFAGDRLRVKLHALKGEKWVDGVLPLRDPDDLR